MDIVKCEINMAFITCVTNGTKGPSMISSIKCRDIIVKGKSLQICHSIRSGSFKSVQSINLIDYKHRRKIWCMFPHSGLLCLVILHLMVIVFSLFRHMCRMPTIFCRQFINNNSYNKETSISSNCSYLFMFTELFALNNKLNPQFPIIIVFFIHFHFHF